MYTMYCTLYMYILTELEKDRKKCVCTDRQTDREREGEENVGEESTWKRGITLRHKIKVQLSIIKFLV